MVITEIVAKEVAEIQEETGKVIGDRQAAMVGRREVGKVKAAAVAAATGIKVNGTMGVRAGLDKQTTETIKIGIITANIKTGAGR